MSWGAIAGAVISVGAGAASSAMNKGEDGSIGYDMPMMTPGPWDQQNQMLTSQLGQNMALNAQQGRLSPGQEILMNKMKDYQLLQNKKDTFGINGQRGGSIMNNTMAMGSMGGVGPKAMMAQGSRAMQDYAGRDAQISNYIDSLKMTGLMNNEKTSAAIMQGMPRSAEIPYTGRTVDMSTPAQGGMDTGLGNVDWVKAMQNTGWFNKDQNLAQYQKMTGNQANTVIPMGKVNGIQPGQSGALYGQADNTVYPLAY